jgi:hypothetical protein
LQHFGVEIALARKVFVETAMGEAAPLMICWIDTPSNPKRLNSFRALWMILARVSGL